MSASVFQSPVRNEAFLPSTTYDNMRTRPYDDQALSPASKRSKTEPDAQQVPASVPSKLPSFSRAASGDEPKSPTKSRASKLSALLPPLPITGGVKPTGDGSDGFPSRSIFGVAHRAYLSKVTKRRDKSLVTPAMHGAALAVLLDEGGWHKLAKGIKDESEGERDRPAWRSWVRKTFRLTTEMDSAAPAAAGATSSGPGVHSLVDNKPVVAPSQLYDVLVFSHRLTGHGGRDKTHAFLRKYFANVPKELIQAFVKSCPTCSCKHSVATLDETAEPWTPTSMDMHSDTQSLHSGQSSVVSSPVKAGHHHLAQATVPSVSFVPPSPFDNTRREPMTTISGMALLEATGVNAPHHNLYGGSNGQLGPSSASGAEMERRESSMSSASSGSGSTNSTSGPLTPAFDTEFPAHEVSFHPSSSGKVSSLDWAAVAQQMLIQKETEARKRQELERDLEHALKASAVTNHHIWPQQHHQEFDAPPFGPGLGATTGGSLRRANKPSPLKFAPPNASMRDPVEAPPTSSTLSVYSNASGYSAVSEPNVQPNQPFDLDRDERVTRSEFLNPRRNFGHPPASAPPTQLTHPHVNALHDPWPNPEQDPRSEHEHTGKHGKLNSSNEDHVEQRIATPLSAVPPSTTASFGPTYGAVFGNVVGGCGNLFASDKVAPAPVSRTVFGAPDLQVYLSPAYGIPGLSGQEGSRPQEQHAQQPNVGGEFDKNQAPSPMRENQLHVAPELLRRHSVAVDHPTSRSPNRNNGQDHALPSVAPSLSRLQHVQHALTSGLLQEQEQSFHSQHSHEQSFHLRERARHEADVTLSSAPSFESWGRGALDLDPNDSASDSELSFSSSHDGGSVHSAHSRTESVGSITASALGRMTLEAPSAFMSGNTWLSLSADGDDHHPRAEIGDDSRDTDPSSDDSRATIREIPILDTSRRGSADARADYSHQADIFQHQHHGDHHKTPSLRHCHSMSELSAMSDFASSDVLEGWVDNFIRDNPNF